VASISGLKSCYRSILSVYPVGLTFHSMPPQNGPTARLLHLPSVSVGTLRIRRLHGVTAKACREGIPMASLARCASPLYCEEKLLSNRPFSLPSSWRGPALRGAYFRMKLEPALCSCAAVFPPATMRLVLRGMVGWRVGNR